MGEDHCFHPCFKGFFSLSSFFLPDRRFQFLIFRVVVIDHVTEEILSFCIDNLATHLKKIYWVSVISETKYQERGGGALKQLNIPLMRGEGY